MRWDRVLLTLCVLLAAGLFWVWRRGEVHLVDVELRLPDGLTAARVEFQGPLSRPAPETAPDATERGPLDWAVEPGHWRVRYGGFTVPFLALPDDDSLTLDLSAPPPQGLVPVPAGRYLRWPDGAVLETRTFIAAARHEVSRRSFVEFLRAVEKHGPAQWASEEEVAAYPNGLIGYGAAKDQKLGQQRPGEELPAAGMSWFAAKAYCRWLTATRGEGKWKYRLPTAAEWDKMARGTDARRHPWGNDAAPVPLLNLGLGPVAIDSHPELASPYGLLHMETNVSEWVEDAFDASGIRRVIKGGSWSQYGDTLRTEARIGTPCTRRSPVTGFRVVAERIR